MTFLITEQEIANKTIIEDCNCKNRKLEKLEEPELRYDDVK